MYANDTLSNFMVPSKSQFKGLTGSLIDTGISSISKILYPEAMALCMTLYCMEMVFIGSKNL